MKRRRAVRGVLLALIAVFATVGAAGALEVGQKAPEFALPGSAGKEVKLADLLGKGPVVIYTFIQAFTGT